MQMKNCAAAKTVMFFTKISNELNYWKISLVKKSSIFGKIPFSFSNVYLLKSPLRVRILYIKGGGAGVKRWCTVSNNLPWFQGELFNSFASKNEKSGVLWNLHILTSKVLWNGGSHNKNSFSNQVNTNYRMAWNGRIWEFLSFSKFFLPVATLRKRKEYIRPLKITSLRILCFFPSRFVSGKHCFKKFKKKFREKKRSRAVSDFFSVFRTYIAIHLDFEWESIINQI